MQKDPPIYTAEFVFHPEHDKDYRHFEKAKDHPFQPRADSVSRVNAWWLAEAALLSYWDETNAPALFANTAGLQSKYLKGDRTGTDCYVAWNQDFVLVAFRGTQPDEWKDILADAKAKQVSWDAGLVHQGFADAIGDIWPTVTEKLHELSGRRVWFCGHSLGAALATLAAYRFKETSGVCTFGCPRVGNRDFTDAFNRRLGRRSLRYVNDHDVVTHVPPEKFLEFTYDHVAVRRFIAEDGQISEQAEPKIPHFFADLIGMPSTLLEQILSLLGSPLPLAPMFLLDHMPKAYAIWTWNDYDAHP
jgi:triacylglycerol lipase